MTRQLNFGRRAAASGRARSMVVFVHGYGADGADLLGLADPLAPHLPDTVFVAPDAPESCAGNPFGSSVVSDSAAGWFNRGGGGGRACGRGR